MKGSAASLVVAPITVSLVLGVVLAEEGRVDRPLGLDDLGEGLQVLVDHRLDDLWTGG